MAGTNLTPQPGTSKRKRDSVPAPISISTSGPVLAPGQEVEVHPDLRQQVCRRCTLAWPWVIFQRNEDDSRNLEEVDCYSCIGIMDKQWELNHLEMDDQIARAKRKLLHVNLDLDHDLNVSTTTPVTGTRTPTITLRVPSTSESHRRRHEPKALPTPASTPIQPLPGSQSQTSAQRFAQAQTQASARAHAQARAQVRADTQARAQAQAQAQVQAQGQARGRVHPPPYSPGMYQNQRQNVNTPPLPAYGSIQGAHQRPAYTNELPDHIIQLYRSPEPARALHWISMNYQFISVATAIPQLDLYHHYIQSIPHTGYPPLMNGRDFILAAAKHFGSSGVSLDKTNFTIGGLWRRARPNVDVLNGLGHARM